MEEKKTIGEKIKKWRAKKNLTQDALAKMAKMPYYNGLGILDRYKRYRYNEVI